MAFVQSVRTAGSAVLTLTSPSMTTTTGNVLAVGASFDSAGATVADNKGNTAWDATAVSTDAYKGRVFTKQDVVGGSGHTVTVTTDSTDYPTLQFAEYSGRDTSSSYRDQTVYAQSFAPANAFTGPAINPSVAGCDAFAFGSTSLDGGVLTITGTNGWTALAQSGTGGVGDNGDGGAYYSSMGLYRSDLATGSQNPTATMGGSWSGHSCAMFVVTFRPSAGGTVYEVSIAESASATDALDQGAPFDGDVFDFDVFDMDPVGGSGTHNVSVAETGSGADTLSAIATLVRSLTETAAATDTPSAARVSPVAIAETGAATDTPTAAGVFPRSVAETGAATDAPSATYTAAASLAEAGAATDTVSAIATLTVTISEAGSATDQVASGATTHSVTVTETGTAADAVSAALQALASVLETGSAADVLSTSAALLAAVAEAGSASDSVSAGAAVQSASVAETAAATDTVSAAGVFVRAVTEVANAADTYTAQAALVAQLLETGAATDSVAAAALLLASLAEVATATDQVDWIGAGGPVAMLVVTADGRDRRFAVGWHDGRLLVTETTDRHLAAPVRQDTQATGPLEGLMRPPRLH
jgi:hypothetical protein